MNTLLTIGLIIFTISSAVFLFVKPKDFNTPFLVNFITLSSYALMLEGSFSFGQVEDTAIYWTRWVFYAFSCTLLTYGISQVLEKKTKETINLIYLTAIVMLTGALSSYYSGTFMLIFFVISTVAYILLILPILRSSSPHRSAVTKYILLGWTGFPVVFLFSPEALGMIGNESAGVLYLVFDVFTKIVFYIEFSKKSLPY
ncbi:MAG: bacteriorhodopsin [Spirulinaceae cyanobacterium]